MRQPKVATQPCVSLGQNVGSLVCSCSGKAKIWTCKNAETPNGYCVPMLPREWLDGPIRFSNGQTSEKRFLPWPWAEDKPTPENAILTCASCPRREVAPELIWEQPKLTAIVYSDEPRAEVVNPDAKTCVLTGYTPTGIWRKIGTLTSATMRSYCLKHGYGLRVRLDAVPGQHPSWSKVHWILEALEHHETVLWLDADAAITNPAVRIEDRAGLDLTLCTDPIGLNCGVIIARRSDWTCQFLERLWGERHQAYRLWEQDAVHRALWRGELDGHLTIRPPRMFNARLPADNRKEEDVANWRPGDWIGHWYNCQGDIEKKRRLIEASITTVNGCC